MLASVLESDISVEVSIEIVRAFIRMRETIAEHRDLARRLETLERRYEHHDRRFKEVFDAIRELMAPEGESGRHRLPGAGFGVRTRAAVAAPARRAGRGGRLFHGKFLAECAGSVLPGITVS
jgi:hypothetical protein